ncbi:hypothetical protein PENANT_c015G08143 [Penicillium antarcticum]|uniref:Uncharacterized protein n=1 Tax=Penicillium antarcticum TaxID=416450 RepID=A0A1V6Q462_9EURO|nr:hypothetical protein PENANT_c015G08143 [Penicillium antarcticum]
MSTSMTAFTRWGIVFPNHDIPVPWPIWPALLVTSVRIRLAILISRAWNLGHERGYHAVLKPPAQDAPRQNPHAYTNTLLLLSPLPPFLPKALPLPKYQLPARPPVEKSPRLHFDTTPAILAYADHAEQLEQFPRNRASPSSTSDLAPSRDVHDDFDASTDAPFCSDSLLPNQLRTQVSANITTPKLTFTKNSFSSLRSHFTSLSVDERLQFVSWLFEGAVPRCLSQSDSEAPERIARPARHLGESDDSAEPHGNFRKGMPLMVVDVWHDVWEAAGERRTDTIKVYALYDACTDQFAKWSDGRAGIEVER